MNSLSYEDLIEHLVDCCCNNVEREMDLVDEGTSEKYIKDFDTHQSVVFALVIIAQSLDSIDASLKKLVLDNRKVKYR